MTSTVTRDPLMLVPVRVSAGSAASQLTAAWFTAWVAWAWLALASVSAVSGAATATAAAARPQAEPDPAGGGLEAAGRDEAAGHQHHRADEHDGDQVRHEQQHRPAGQVFPPDGQGEPGRGQRRDQCHRDGDAGQRGRYVLPRGGVGPGGPGGQRHGQVPQVRAGAGQHRRGQHLAARGKHEVRARRCPRRRPSGQHGQPRLPQPPGPAHDQGRGGADDRGHQRGDQHGADDDGIGVQGQPQHRDDHRQGEHHREPEPPLAARQPPGTGRPGSAAGPAGASTARGRHRSQDRATRTPGTESGVRTSSTRDPPLRAAERHQRHRGRRTPMQRAESVRPDVARRVNAAMVAMPEPAVTPRFRLPRPCLGHVPEPGNLRAQCIFWTAAGPGRRLADAAPDGGSGSALIPSI